MRTHRPTEHPTGCEPAVLWGWPEVLARVPISRRTLERELSAARFPRPALRVGKRPFWRPVDVIRWAEGGAS
jgi:predicted DNA-binding transcriptional regulator AlpA